MADWRTVQEFPAYEVSDEGALRRADNHRPLASMPDNTGYARVTFSVPGKKTYRYIHRLVAVAFLGPVPYGSIVCHTNGNPLDNRPANLRYGSHRDNRLDAVRHGTAANSRPRFSPERRAEIRAAANLPTRELVATFGISTSFARYVRQRAV